MNKSLLNTSLYQIISFFKKKYSRQTFNEKIFYFDAIEYYAKNNKDRSTSYQINENTMNDIDFYELFKILDKTKSKVGQQYLFNQLITLENKNDFGEQEKWIKYLLQYPETKVKIEKILSKLENKESYYLSNLIFDEYIERPKWLWVTKILMALPLISFLLTFISNGFIFFTNSLYHNQFSTPLL